ncbi:amino acid/peptide transporter [Pseudopedobacter saltans DSM 12145]|uniref:Amino acid/peptide transporter n=1 Tax=Pseudopedobacter saltans (strain ATCC 51119 / DSM 12145 / JCM 21818 / CCUG 39354 / LMG 10337 / NBRC 100064 / NCIMB 13643) TaxID=762903 RepID=F0SCE3_PSESL|nr:peptide MFS transporter [Pseudopedobacter saltans]ADY52777.1 amino acid/peptide transporter [Pseudopedobacter saltans DSM 12145]
MLKSQDAENDFFKSNVLGHPSGLFVLFFTEMWERFSYYGMRALLVLFLTSSILGDNAGWGWPRENALAIYGSYTSLAYLTPILGGYVADRIIGYRWAVIVGAFLMTLGHLSMAFEFNPIFMYLGLCLLVLGNGFFKPNMTSIIAQMYEKHPEKKDGAYTIFYMGVNAGAFLGMLLCGYIGESPDWGWSYGFGLAGVFMLLGMLQFYFTQGIFGHIGEKPVYDGETIATANEKPEEAKRNPFSNFDLTVISIIAVIGLTWVINDPLSKITSVNLFNFSVGSMTGNTFIIIIALALFLFILVKRILQYTPVLRDKMIAVIILAFFTIFFWASFEQAGGSMTIFAKDYTARILEGNAKIVFNIVNTLITVVPLIVITYVLYKLFRQTFQRFTFGNIILAFAFIIIWSLVIFMLKAQYLTEQAEVPATWFGVLNALFIITLAPIFSRIWESKYNPFATYKNGIGMILLGTGFAVLAYGASGIPQGAQTAAVSMMWLVFAYLFHTMGELCISPVGLSYVSKLVPGRMIAIMFGIWYLAIAIGNKIAGTMGGMIDEITAQYSMSTFFLIFTIIPISLGLLIILLTPVMKKLMHGVK